MAVSFSKQILPLFTNIDIEHMAPSGVKLNDYDWMKAPGNAAEVYGRLTGKTGRQMPPEGPWPQSQIDLFQQWMEDGLLP